MQVRLETKQTLTIDETHWRTLWSGNFSTAIGESYSIWTAAMLRDRQGRSLIYVARDDTEGESEAVGELGRPQPEDIAPILRRLCERAGLDEYPDTWEVPAAEAPFRGDNAPAS